MFVSRRIAAALIYLALYLVADLAAPIHLYAGFPTLPWNAAPALSFGFAVRFGRSWLALTLAAPLLAGLADGTLLSSPLSAVLRALAESGGTALAVYLLRPPSRPPIDLKQLRGFFVFLGVSTGAAAAIACLRALGEGILAQASFWPSFNLANELFLSHVVAILSVAPLILIHNLPKRRLDLRFPLTAEVILQMGAMTLIAWEVFGRFVNAEIHFFYLLFLPFAWIAARHGQKGASLALGAIYVAPVLTDILFGHKDQMIVEMQIRLGVLAVTSLLFGAMVAERRLAEIRMQERQTELAHFQRLNVGWEMASALAHELNQPLTAAMNLTQAALRLLMAPSPDLERTATVMRMSVDRIERVGQIIHGLRDFMRKGELQLSTNAIGSLAEDALRLVSGEAKASGITLETAGMLSLPPVMADKTQIVQVLINLLRNAIQSLALADIEHPRISVSGRKLDDMIEISVADNGPGLPPQVMNHLFEPFITTKASGMGLGLSISKSILEAHEGRLWAENAPAGGAIFRFTLPLAARELPNA